MTLRSTAAIGCVVAVLATGSALADPSVDLIWTATTGAGVTGGSAIGALPGDTLTLDIVVNDNGAGLTGVFLTLEYDSANLLGTTAVNCPIPPNVIVPGECNTPTGDLLAPLVSPITISNVGAGSTLSLFSPVAVTGTVATSFALTVGRATFVMGGGNGSVSLLYQPGLEWITDNAFTGYSPPASAVVGDAGLDSDTDGLSDGDELLLYGTDPFDADSDDDGLWDGVEVAAGTDPLDEDTDGDFVCDGGSVVGTCTTAGPDNCPFLPNPDQTNSDPFSAGDACQCGDLNLDNVVNGADALLARQHVVRATIGGACELTRCNVIGPADAGVSSDCNVGASSDCTVADVYVLERVAAGKPVTLENSCRAYTGP
jgi:hypothetical protein